MKRLLLFLALAPFLAHTAAAASNGSMAVLANVRYHQTNETVADWPFDKDDFSYGLSLAFYDGAGYLELGANYAPDSSLDTVDSVLTPFARIVIVDQFIAAGIGIRDNYVFVSDASDQKDDWADLLYELYLGVEIPLGSFVLGGGAYYTFDSWSEFSDFDTDFLEYGVHLGFRF